MSICFKLLLNLFNKSCFSRSSEIRSWWRPNPDHPLSRLLRRCQNHGQQKNVSDHKNKIGLKKRTLRNHRTIKYKMFSAFELAVSSHATSFNRSKSLNFKSLNSRIAENYFQGSGPWRGGWVFASWLKSWSSIKFVLFSNFGKQEEVEKSEQKKFYF